MPSYEICYRDAHGEKLETFWVPCGGDKQAKILAHAMRPPMARRIEVWDGETLIYERPEVAARAPIVQSLTRAA
ncbi:MAG: hypothetical protein GC166_00610 [Alphaproteobacteria bacterium]|nr:hypothetical protein [Alphaproteobacteria bacterium]